MSQLIDGLLGRVRVVLPVFRFQITLSVLSILVFTSPVSAQWTNVGAGVDYQYFRVGGTNDFFVSRMTRTNTSTTIDTSIAHDLMAGSFEIVRSQAARQDDAITWWGGSWGARNKVVIAVNGGFYNTSTGVIDGGQIQSGWYAHWFPNKGSFSGFAWKTDRTAFFGECVTHTAAKVYVKFVSNAANEPIDGVNRTNAASDLVIFTPQYDNQTPSGTRTEVLVEMTRPNLTTSGSGYSSGIIRSVAQNTGSTWIPFDHLVLSASGSEGTTLKNNSSVGSEIRIFQELVESNEPDVQGNSACQTATGRDWSNVFAAINSNYHFLKNNVVRVPDAVAHPGYIGYVNLNPRTAICWNSSYIFFVVVDGRSTRSKGIGCADLGYWAKAVLGATDGVNNDGGGSSTMVVNGVVKNVPSDGNERAVFNGLMMVNVLPKSVSAIFATGQTVTTTASASVRLGPGSNYGLYATVAKSAQGTVVSHSLNGVFAKGTYWWKCNFNGTIGWIAETSLIVPTTAPSITQQPANQNVTAGGTAGFTVTSTGTAPLSYRWQKNNVNLSNGGHYSGSTTNSLTVSNCDTNDAAGYRCVVSNAYGSATSSVATLTVAVTCAPGILQNASFEGGNSGGVEAGWTGYQRAPNPATVWSIQTSSPADGLQYQQIANTSSTGGGGVRQTITGCIIGATYTFSGWMRGNSASATCTVKCSPTVSTDWSTANDLSPLQTSSGSTWTAFSGAMVATGTNMTLWLDGQTGGTGLNKAECFDGVTITCLGGDTAPNITQQPLNQTVAPGDPASFTVAATGSEPLGYRWQKNNVNLSNGGHYSGSTTTTLTITGADTNDVASYRCVVTNAFGSLNSGSATLTVTNANNSPSIMQQPSNQSVIAGGNASFTVLASGSNPLSYQWQKSNVDLGNGGHYAGSTTTTLMITGADSNDFASYRCVVTNAYGVTNSDVATLAEITLNPCFGVANSDFESGFSLAGGGYIANNWTEWEGDPGVVVGFDETAVVHGGGHSQRIRIWGSTNGTSGGVYQQIPVTAGQPYSVSVWMYAADALSACSLGVDPAGGTNANGGVTWSSASTNVTWVQKTLTGTGAADSITVYYRVTSSDNVKRNGYFDDAAPAVASGAPELAVQLNGDALVLTWPACPGAHLERADGLVVPMNWVTVTNQVSVSGGQKSVTLIPTDSAGFFRLVLE